MQENEYRKFITDWNVKYPLDRWWRVKYNIPFNSSNHREVQISDIRIQYEEDRLFNEILSPQEDRKYIPGMGDFLIKRESKITNEQTIDLFNAIDVDQMNTPDNIGKKQLTITHGRK